ncbi:MAG: Uncharacterised protein [Owenweeksia sp. TMED14]|nr:MAG: Uncharacterised protein [Owenweeksia sp. TMED14]
MISEQRTSCLLGMKKIAPLFLLLTLILTSCGKQNTHEKAGYNMLLMGHSFFKPYADRLEEVVSESGIVNHNQTRIFRGGAQGSPDSLWNWTGSENTLIKKTLDNGNVDIFGMTSGPLQENPTDGYIEWISYALQNNPDIKVFISIGQPDFPNDWEQTAQDYGFSSAHVGYEYHVNYRIHKTLIDSLRAKFPSTNIFSIPTGKAGLSLWQMQKDGLLLDSISYIGPFESSLFTDEKGHQGEMTAYTGALMWLKSLYQVDLSANSFVTGFNTDLHSVAEAMINSHDPDYNQ